MLLLLYVVVAVVVVVDFSASSSFPFGGPFSFTTTHVKRVFLAGGRGERPHTLGFLRAHTHGQNTHITLWKIMKIYRRRILLYWPGFKACFLPSFYLPLDVTWPPFFSVTSVCLLFLSLSNPGRLGPLVLQRERPPLLYMVKECAKKGTKSILSTPSSKPGKGRTFQVLVQWSFSCFFMRAGANPHDLVHPVLVCTDLLLLVYYVLHTRQKNPFLAYLEVCVWGSANQTRTPMQIYLSVENPIINLSHSGFFPIFFFRVCLHPARVVKCMRENSPLFPKTSEIGGRRRPPSSSQ